MAKTFYEIGCMVWDRISNTSFTVLLKNGTVRLVRCITLGRRGLPMTNALAFGAHSKVMNNMKCCDSKDCIYNTLISS
jgi:hypothetical protein